MSSEKINWMSSISKTLKKKNGSILKCNYCGKAKHKNREKESNVFNKSCNEYVIKGHLKNVCRQKT